MDFFISKIIEYLVDGGWGSIVESFFFDPIFSGGALSTFIHLSLGKAGPITLENHIYAKALKMPGFPNNQMPYCLIKPLVKNSTQNNFSGVYPMSDPDPQ